MKLKEKQFLKGMTQIENLMLDKRITESEAENFKTLLKEELKNTEKTNLYIEVAITTKGI